MWYLWKCNIAHIIWMTLKDFWESEQQLRRMNLKLLAHSSLRGFSGHSFCEVNMLVFTFQSQTWRLIPLSFSCVKKFGLKKNYFQNKNKQIEPSAQTDHKNDPHSKQNTENFIKSLGLNWVIKTLLAAASFRADKFLITLNNLGLLKTAGSKIELIDAFRVVKAIKKEDIRGHLAFSFHPLKCG